nr:hypothetical protein CFP56_20743 [Quercus suber]
MQIKSFFHAAADDGGDVKNLSSKKPIKVQLARSGQAGFLFGFYSGSEWAVLFMVYWVILVPFIGPEEPDILGTLKRKWQSLIWLFLIDFLIIESQVGSLVRCDAILVCSCWKSMPAPWVCTSIHAYRACDLSMVAGDSFGLGLLLIEFLAMESKNVENNLFSGPICAKLLSVPNFSTTSYALFKTIVWDGSGGQLQGREVSSWDAKLAIILTN